MNLTTEEQRTLTEWLGECWHEVATSRPYHDGATIHHCKCRQSFVTDKSTILPIRDDFDRLDFSDWRVVGRLIEKAQKTHSIHVSSNGQAKNCWQCVIGYQRPYRFSSIMQNTPQEAICRAVLAYLEE